MATRISTLVERTAKELTELSLAAQPGDYIGSEADLLDRFKVSRPTLRQAAKMVANDRLISVRRGTHGGFYSDRPDARDSVRAVARYLRLNGGRLEHVVAVTGAISEQIGDGAARCTDEGLRAELADFASRIDEAELPGDLVRSENELVSLLARMTGNPAMELVLAIGFSFGMDEEQVRFFRQPEDRRKMRELQHALCRAVLAGDREIARLLMKRRSQVFHEWMSEFADRPV